MRSHHAKPIGFSLAIAAIEMQYSSCPEYKEDVPKKKWRMHIVETIYGKKLEGCNTRESVYADSKDACDPDEINNETDSLEEAMKSMMSKK